MIAARIPYVWPQVRKDQGDQLAAQALLHSRIKHGGAQ